MCRAPKYILFSNDTVTTEIYTLSLHDALPISPEQGWPTTGPCGHSRHRTGGCASAMREPQPRPERVPRSLRETDRKSTRLNSSHANISYAVFCLKTHPYLVFIALLE